MTIYFVAYASIVLFCVLTRNTKCNEDKKRRRMFLFSFIVIFLLFALRAQNMGNDLTGYLPAFDYFSKMSWKDILSLQRFQNYEKGYIIFNKLISIVSSDRQFFLGACAFISIFPIMFNTYKSKANYLFATLIFMGIPAFPLLFSGLRQGIALGICSFSLVFIPRKKILPFVAIVLGATLFHFSAIVFLLAYPLYRIRIKKTVRLITIVLLPVFYLLRYRIFNTFAVLLREDAIADNNNAIGLFVAFSLIYIFCCLFYDRDDEQQNGYLNLFYFACICQAMGGVKSTVVRVGYYYMLSLIVLLPTLMERIDDRDRASIITVSDEKSKKIISFIIALAFVTFGLYTLRNGTWSGSYPYHFFWEQ